MERLANRGDDRIAPAESARETARAGHSAAGQRTTGRRIRINAETAEHRGSEKSNEAESQRMTAVKSAAGVAGYILAGGGSTRFGRDKALAEVGGTPMLERMIELLRRVPMHVTVIASPGKYAACGAQIVQDRWPGEGPLGGIITALEDAAQSAARPEWNLMVS